MAKTKTKIESKEKAIALPPEVKAVIVIKSQEDMVEATKTLSVLNKTLDLLTEKKELLTKPLNAALKEIRSRYKDPETMLQNKISEIRERMSEYQTKQVAIADKKEAKVADKLASGDISIEKAADAMSKLPTVQTKTETDEGSIKFKPVPKFEVVDLAQVPMEYHLANEVKIRAAMNGGTQLPGVRYWTDQVPYNSR